MVDGSALKKSITGFALLSVGAGGGGGGGGGAFFLPHAASVIIAAAVKARLTRRRFVIPRNNLLGSHPFCFLSYFFAANIYNIHCAAGAQTGFSLLP
jgi:hypothetical protein